MLGRLRRSQAERGFDHVALESRRLVDRIEHGGAESAARCDATSLSSSMHVGHATQSRRTSGASTADANDLGVLVPASGRTRGARSPLCVDPSESVGRAELPSEANDGRRLQGTNPVLAPDILPPPIER